MHRKNITSNNKFNPVDNNILNFIRKISRVSQTETKLNFIF